jgi:ATP-binding protein involved in chromosome partitioning
VPFLGKVELDPDIRRGGDTGHPVVLAGEQGEHSKSFYALAKSVIARVEEQNAAAPQDFLKIQ